MKRFILSICFSVMFFMCFAQFNNLNDYVTKIWTSVDGLPGNSICDIYQSDDGYMYFGTYECLVRFDGTEFVTYNKYIDSKYSFISARSVFQDSDKNFWIGSNDEGVQKIGQDENITFNIQSGLPNNSIRSIVEDKNHNIWIGTASGVVYINQDNKIVFPKCEDDINLNHVIVNQLYCDTANRIWMLCNDLNGLYIYSNGVFSKYSEINKVVSDDFYASSITQDKNGDLWLSLGQKGLFKIEKDKISPIVSGQITDSISTNCIYCDPVGSLWFGTERGLILYKDGVFANYEENNILANSSINKILGDREGNVWLATGSGGIAKISPGKFRMNKINIPVNAICEDKNGNIWIGNDEGIICLQNEKPVENNLTDFCRGIRIRHIECLKDGKLLVNWYSQPAQVMYDGENIVYWDKEKGLSGNKTRVSIQDKKGNIYCGTTTGLSIIKPDGEIVNYNNQNYLDNEYIMCLYEDRDGLIWVGTDGGGIYVFENENIIRTITTEDGFSGNVVFKICQDKKGMFWICTGSGITVFEKGTGNIKNQDIASSAFNYNSGAGLGSDSIFQVIFDDSDYVWMVSNRGLSSVQYEDFVEIKNGEKKQLDAKFYTENDGLKSSGANSTALSMKDSHGRIWFTMADGYASYDPLRAKFITVKPLVHIEYVKVDDKVVTNVDNPVLIPAGTKHIDIKYTGFSYATSDRNRFSYMLEGFDNDFSDLSSNRMVSYTNLKPGSYTFIVNILNGEGYSSELPGTVDLIQIPFIYQRLEFWIAVGVLFVLILSFSFYLVNYTNKKRRLLLETKIQMATVELEMAKDDSDRLLKNILPVSIAERMKGFGGEKTIADTFENVTVLFSDIVGFTKKTGNASAEEIVSSLNQLTSLFDKRAENLGIEKIKTIGDSYMAACGVPEANEKHAVIMLKFAIGMFKDLAEYNKTAKIKYNIRIGMNSGKVVAGIIGKNKFIYDIWGDTVNVASRMESCCTPGHIRFTESVKENLDIHHVSYKCRTEECDVKGKGLMLTYEIPE